MKILQRNYFLLYSQFYLNDLFKFIQSLHIMYGGNIKLFDK